MSSSESMAEVGPSTTGTAAANLVPPPPPQPHRRPRVREVSSRFMTPVASHSSSFSPLPNIKHQRSSSVQRQRSSSSTEPLGSADENRQSSESSSSSFFGRCSPQRKQHQPHSRAVVKLFKENNGAGGGREFQPPLSRSHRPDTPTVATAAASSASVSRLRLMQQRSTHISAAARLLQSSGMSSNPNPVESSTISSSSSSSEGNDGEVSSQPVQSCSPWSLPDVLRSSMPEVDMLPSVRTVSRTSSTPIPNDSSAKLFSASPCSRSLNLPRPNSESSVFHSLKEKPPSSKTGSLKLGGLPLPPVPPYVAAAGGGGGGGGGGKVVSNTDSLRKGRKVSGHQEDVQSLRLLYNRYLQWRFANAKAEISGQAQRRETERALYSLTMRISELRDSVTRKRTQLGVLQKMRTLSTILDAQMPYLDEWSAFEGEYSVSLSETIEALSNASLRIPISGNIRVDIREMEEALNSATKLMESIAVNIQSFIPQAEEIEALISDLARLTGGERSLIEECGDMLSSTHKSQVEECSLRSQLIQLQRTCHV